MMETRSKEVNPFLITKAVDLDDPGIQSLWVDLPLESGDVTDLLRPRSPMPTFLLGAKGSGKTHLMRYHSFELQSLRAGADRLDIRNAITRDGFLGLYVRCNALNPGRFSGKRQSAERWQALFSYYLELWLAQHLLRVFGELKIDSDSASEAALVRQIMMLFDKQPDMIPSSLPELLELLSSLQRDLDFQINNCVLTNRIDAAILVTRGRLIFGIPQIFSRIYKFLENVIFVYTIDEFEVLSNDQQIIINSLIRDRELPSTLRIGARLYGIKTYATDSDQEENRRNSEFDEVVLDDRFRQHKRRYVKFARDLVYKRFDAAGARGLPSPSTGSAVDWSTIFETEDENWNSAHWLKVVSYKESENRRHFEVLKQKLERKGYFNTNSQIDRLYFPDYPLLEKVCILMLYQDLFRNKLLSSSIDDISDQCRAFILGNGVANRFAGVLEHYKSDLCAQLRRENDVKQSYLGLDAFIMMSSGLPRGLLTILRSTFEWSVFNGEEPLRNHRISKEAQLRGVREASDWFFEYMRKAGEDGLLIQRSIDRLARLFRANRFADRPAECSLIAFTVAEHELSVEARRVMRLAEGRSFLNRIAGGQRDKNSEQVTLKMQLNAMLCPRWDLPLGRRGAISLSPRIVDAIFDPAKEAEFEHELGLFRERLTAPNFGVKAPSDDADNRQGSLL